MVLDDALGIVPKIFIQLRNVRIINILICHLCQYVYFLDLFVRKCWLVLRVKCISDNFSHSLIL